VAEESNSPVGVKLFEPTQNIGQICVKNHVDEVIIALPPESHHKMADIVSQCHGLGVKLMAAPDLYEMFLSKTDGGEINGLPLVEVMAPPIRGINDVLKRLFDIVISTLVLLFLSPFALLCMFLVKVESRGEVFFKQERVGKDGRSFILYKFRTMHQDAEKTTGPILASEGDPRMTKVGRILRRVHMDELPQLWNVLRGDMSLVGPRPERPFFVEQFKREIPGYVNRLQVKPGIMGLAQVRSNYDTPARAKLMYDLLYPRNSSLILDFWIILKSIWRYLICRDRTKSSERSERPI
jgi:exopolysaccharide biosynthesis polyprenyl glycosylphosphotransferase